MEKNRNESLGLSLDEEIELALGNNVNENTKEVKKVENITESKKHEYTDYDLLDILENAGYEATFKNLRILREGIEDGSINLEEPEKTNDAKKELDNEHILTDNNIDKEVKKDLEKDEYCKSEKPVVVKESKLLRSHSDSFLKSYLLEDCKMSQKDVISLTEEEKVDSLKELAKAVIYSINSKIDGLDTSLADKSRGDIKNLKILSDLQNAITQLEAIVERADNYNPDCKKYIGVVIKSILYLNQCTPTFKEAYRNKKTLLILKYETIIMSIISATAYLISQIVDFRSQTLGMKSIIEIEEIAPLKTLMNFIKSVDSGEFKIVANDVGVLREYYKEIPVEKLSTICEAPDIITLVSDGIRRIYDGLDKNKITQLLYKATGIVVLLLSVRDAVYSLYRMKTKVADMSTMISNFANVNVGGGLKSLVSFANRFIPDAESASDMASNEIYDDNRKLVTQLKAIKTAPVIDSGNDDLSLTVQQDSIVGKQENIPAANDIFSF